MREIQPPYITAAIEKLRDCRGTQNTWDDRALWILQHVDYCTEDEATALSSNAYGSKKKRCETICEIIDRHLLFLETAKQDASRVQGLAERTRKELEQLHALNQEYNAKFLREVAHLVKYDAEISKDFANEQKDVEGVMAQVAKSATNFSMLDQFQLRRFICYSDDLQDFQNLDEKSLEFMRLLGILHLSLASSDRPDTGVSADASYALALYILSISSVELTLDEIICLARLDNFWNQHKNEFPYNEGFTAISNEDPPRENLMRQQLIEKKLALNAGSLFSDSDHHKHLQRINKSRKELGVWFYKIAKWYAPEKMPHYFPAPSSWPDDWHELFRVSNYGPVFKLSSQLSNFLKPTIYASPEDEIEKNLLDFMVELGLLVLQQEQTKVASHSTMSLNPFDEGALLILSCVKSMDFPLGELEKVMHLGGFWGWDDDQGPRFSSNPQRKNIIREQLTQLKDFLSKRLSSFSLASQEMKEGVQKIKQCDALLEKINAEQNGLFLAGAAGAVLGVTAVVFLAAPACAALVAMTPGVLPIVLYFGLIALASVGLTLSSVAALDYFFGLSTARDSFYGFCSSCTALTSSFYNKI